MGRRLLRCRDARCGTPLGTVTPGGDLELAADVERFVVDLVVGRATVRCPSCGTGREFRDGSVYSARPRD